MGKSKTTRCVIVFAELPFGVPSTPSMTWYHKLVCYRRRGSAVLVVHDVGPFLDNGEVTVHDASPDTSGGAGTRGSTAKYMALVHYVIDGLYLLDTDEEISAACGWVEVSVDASQERDANGCVKVGVRKSVGAAPVIVEVPAHAILTVRACVGLGVGVGVGVCLCVPTPIHGGRQPHVYLWLCVCVGGCVCNANVSSDDT